jgi:DNA-binding transcriptional MerR regulator
MPDYSLAELVALSGMPSRTIRYYIAEGLIPAPGRDGPATRYPETTLAKLRLIGKLRVANQPLSAIRQALERLNDVELMEMARTPSMPMPADSALDYIRTLLDESRVRLPEGSPAKGAGPAPFLALSVGSAITPTDEPTPGAPPPGPAAAPGPAAMPAAMPPGPATPTRTEPSTPASTISERSQWERIALVPGIELHVRRPQSRRENRMVERLIAFARQLQGEDQL